MKSIIVYRPLTEKECSTLERETRKSQHIGFIRRDIWKKFGKVFVLENNAQLIGVCVPIHLTRWHKLGPLIVLSKHQGKGLGKQLLSHVTERLSEKNLYIGTPNPRVESIVHTLAFTQTSWWRLPLEIKLYLVSYLFQRFSWEYIADAVRKKFTSHRWKYSYFIRPRQ